jgi:CheY-like chemotaxis protein
VPGAAQQTLVLIADDEKVIAESLAMILSNRGYETRTVHSGEAALEILATFRPDVLVSDVIMPGIDGVTLAERFFHLCPECKVILMSGNAGSSAMIEMAARHGPMYAYLQKPFHPAALLEILTSFETGS